MEKKKVGIIFGGRSGEHEVSLLSAYNVISALDSEKYDRCLIGITKEGKWIIYSGDAEKIKDGSWEQDSGSFRENFSVFSDEEFCSIDVFFAVLHGTFGEDGTIQGMFEMLGKPYVGCGVLASSLAMDKSVSKSVFQNAGIPVAGAVTLYKDQICGDIGGCIDVLRSSFDFPMFVKPANMGSSVGISKAVDADSLKAALFEASLYDSKVIVEEFIVGREIEVAVLGNDDPQASCAGMVIPCNEFYDYEAKYLRGDDSEIIIPAPISEEAENRIRDTALKAYKEIGGSGLSRIDFFLTKQDKIYLNEINTMPGFTNISMYAKLWQHCGVPYSELIERLIELAFERYDKRTELKYEKD